MLPHLILQLNNFVKQKLVSALFYKLHECLYVSFWHIGALVGANSFAGIISTPPCLKSIKIVCLLFWLNCNAMCVFLEICTRHVHG